MTGERVRAVFVIIMLIIWVGLWRFCYVDLIKSVILSSVALLISSFISVLVTFIIFVVIYCSSVYIRGYIYNA